MRTWWNIHVDVAREARGDWQIPRNVQGWFSHSRERTDEVGTV